MTDKRLQGTPTSLDGGLLPVMVDGFTLKMGVHSALESRLAMRNRFLDSQWSLYRDSNRNPFLLYKPGSGRVLPRGAGLYEYRINYVKVFKRTLGPDMGQGAYRSGERPRSVQNG